MPRDDLAFTTYVRALRSDEEPSSAVFEAMWKKLRRLLAAELRRRALWNAPPSYLGVYGASGWTDPEAIEELLVDSYEAVFVDRMRSLEALLDDEGAQIDALCVRNLRYVLHERQKRHDPLGHRLFGVLRSAVRRAVEAGMLHVLDGDPRIGTATLLGFATWAEPAGNTDLAEPVATWLEDVLPDLVTAPPSGLKEVEEALCRRLRCLADSGVETFRFKDVLDPLRSAVLKWRDAIWQSEADDADGELAALSGRLRPDGYEERQFFDAVVECVSAALPRTVKTKKSGDQLERYWQFLRGLVAEDRADEVPSQRKIGELLGIQRTRIPEFHEILGRELERCRKACRLPAERGGAA